MMEKRKPQISDTQYTQDDRERYLFRTAAEMRAILDRIDERRKTRTQTTDVDDSLEFSIDDQKGTR